MLKREKIENWIGKNFSAIAELKVETDRIEQQNGVWVLNRSDFSTKTEKWAKRNLKMKNCNKTEYIFDFANHNGFKSWNGKIFLAKQWKAKTSNNV